MRCVETGGRGPCPFWGRNVDILRRRARRQMMKRVGRLAKPCGAPRRSQRIAPVFVAMSSLRMRCDGSWRAERPRHIVVGRANYAVVISRPETNKMRSEEGCYTEVTRLRLKLQRSATTLPPVPEGIGKWRRSVSHEGQYKRTACVREKVQRFGDGEGMRPM